MYLVRRFADSETCFNLMQNTCMVLALLAAFLMVVGAYKYQGSVSKKSILFSSSLDSSFRYGQLALVGAGPGDPDLLTVQALRLIKDASLVVADRLISPEILDLVDCELRIAHKRPGCAEEAQKEIYEWVSAALRQGRSVVRLKIGDPFLFGRGGEEVLHFREELGVEALIAPGLSSSYCAPSAAKIPLTHRGVSSQVLISTGYGKQSSVIDIPPFVEDRTVVLLMAVSRLAEIAANMTSPLLGYPAQTPVAIIESATTPFQRILMGTLATIGMVAQGQGAKPPATIVIGNVCNVLRDS